MPKNKNNKAMKSNALKIILHKSEIPSYLRSPGLPYSVYEAVRAKFTGERYGRNKSVNGIGFFCFCPGMSAKLWKYAA